MGKGALQREQVSAKSGFAVLQWVHRIMAASTSVRALGTGSDYPVHELGLATG
jgi:hypothetical protein